MMTSKKEVRALMRERAARFREAGLEEAASETIWHRVEAMPEFASATKVLIYMSIPGEVRTREFIARWRDSKEFVLPLVCGERLELHAYAPEWLVPGYRGIEEPSADAPSVSPDSLDLVLVPGMAFARTPSGVLRMGRGGGFYDRFLPQVSCPTVGICYSYRIVGSLPTDPWDIPLDKLISDDDAPDAK